LRHVSAVRRTVVGLADMKLSCDQDEELVTYALGSCLGVAIHDPVARVGALAHLMLPLSATDPERAAQQPYLYVDTGVPRLFRAAYAAGADKRRLVVKVAGGGALNEEADDVFQIGRRNFIVLRKLLWQNGVLLQGQDVGGRLSRTMALSIGTGLVTIKSSGEVRRL
jgi:chemotaxis protein CheD